jgi:hypothetical protein
MTGEVSPVAVGNLKQVRIAAETTWGTAPSGSGTSQLLRRVSSDVSEARASYRSNEIQPDRQVHDFRLGMKSVRGTVRAELSPLTYESVFAQLLSGAFTATTADSADTITAAAAVVNTSPGTFVSVKGTPVNFVTSGFKVGDVINASGFTSGAAANNARNYRITGIVTTTATNDTLQVGPTPSTAFPSVGNEAVVAATSATSITLTVVGKKLITPVAGSLNDQSFSIEHWFSDIGHSELFVGCRASRANFNMPPSGIATVDFDVMGQQMYIDEAGAGSPYFTDVTAVTTSGLAVAVNGLLRVGGVDYGIVTGLRFSVNTGMQPEAVIGSNVTPYLFPGIQDITGEFTALFQDEVLQTHFLNEDEISLQMYLTLNSNLNAPFLSFYFPRIKLTSGQKDDKPTAIVGTYGFQALNQINGGSGTTMDETTLTIQDSLAV